MLSSYIIAVDPPAIILNTNNIEIENIVHIIWHTKHKYDFFSFSKLQIKLFSVQLNIK